MKNEMIKREDLFSLARGSCKTGMMMEKIHRAITGNKKPITVEWWMRHGNISEWLKRMVLRNEKRKNS